jgi:hypothetical protein
MVPMVIEISGFQTVMVTGIKRKRFKKLNWYLQYYLYLFTYFIIYYDSSKLDNVKHK